MWTILNVFILGAIVMPVCDGILFPANYSRKFNSRLKTIHSLSNPEGDGSARESIASVSANKLSPQLSAMKEVYTPPQISTKYPPEKKSRTTRGICNQTSTWKSCLQVQEWDLVRKINVPCLWCSKNNRGDSGVCIRQSNSFNKKDYFCYDGSKKKKHNKLPVYTISTQSGRCSLATHEDCRGSSENGAPCVWCKTHCVNFSSYLFLDDDSKGNCEDSHYVKSTRQRDNLRKDWRFEISNCLNKSALSRNILLGYESSNALLNEHYVKLLKETAAWRNCSFNDYQFIGPRIENFWIVEFMRQIRLANNNLEAVFPGGIVPIFSQWVDCVVQHGSQFSENVNHTLSTKLNPEILYVTVSQGAQGIYRTKGHYYMPPNLIIFNCAGYGHIPLPLFNLELPLSQNLCGDGESKVKCKHFSSFVGRLSTGKMRKILFKSAVSRANKGFNDIVLHSRFTPNWETIMESSVTSLAPRGHGRTSFRLYESIQKGILPIYVYDDIEWIPYLGTNASLHNFGFSISIREVESKFEEIRRLLTADEIQRRRNYMISLRRSHYSYEGMMKQIGLYIKFGPAVSDLRCNVLPNTAI
jgi:hypothetical protein